MLIGREKEQTLLKGLVKSDQSEFVALYGRHRVGKTYLVRESFQYRFAFQHTGILDAPMGEQLSEFRESLYTAGLTENASSADTPVRITADELFRRLARESSRF